MIFFLILIVGLASAAPSPSYDDYNNVGYIQTNGIQIYTRNGEINCDTLMCPSTAVRCEVNQENDPNDFSQLIRSRKCLNSNHEVVQESTIREPSYNQSITSHFTSGGLSPEENKRLERNVQQIQHQIQAQIDQTFANLQDQMETLRNQLAHMFD